VFERVRLIEKRDGRWVYMCLVCGEWIAGIREYDEHEDQCKEKVNKEHWRSYRPEEDHRCGR
jgi:hypothetical protein